MNLIGQMKGTKRPDYPDDIFGAQNNEVPNMREHQRATENVNDQAVASDQAADDNDQAEKSLDDDDTRSINSSEDKDERVRDVQSLMRRLA